MFQRICKLLLLLALLWPGASWGAVAYDSSNSTTTTSSTGETFAFNNVAGDFMVCYVGGGDGTSSDFNGTWTATYAGVSMTIIPSSLVYDGIWVGIQGFYLIAPATGSNNVVTTHSSLTQVAVMCASFSGVHQTTPLGTAATNSGTGTTASVTVTSATGEMVVAGVASDNEGGITETGTLILETAAVSSDTIYGIQRYSGAASVSAQWTQGSNAWAASGVSIKPAAGGGGVTLRNLMLMGVGQ